eukprot:g944.t1
MRAMQSTLDGAAAKWSSGMQAGFVSSAARVTVAAGLADAGAARRAVSVRDTFLLGSATKPVTTAAVLQLVDRGVLGLDDAVAPLVNPLLLRANGTTLERLLGPAAANMTVRMLAGMSSGLADYDTGDLRAWTFAHPGRTVSPIDALWAVAALDERERWVCAPGACSQYSSTNFEVLGLLLAALDARAAAAADWSLYAQRSVLERAGSLGPPTALSSNYDNFSFAGRGACARYVSTHGFTQIGTPGGRPLDVSGLDCLNGWTCGNIATTAFDMAAFMYDLLGPVPRIVTNASRAQMMKWHPFTVGWCSGMLYGLGLGPLPTTNETTGVLTALVGHGGDTYGYAAATGYSPTFDFAITLASNNETLGTALLNPHVSDARAASSSSLGADSSCLQRVLSQARVVFENGAFMLPAGTAPRQARTFLSSTLGGSESLSRQFVEDLDALLDDEATFAAALVSLRLGGGSGGASASAAASSYAEPPPSLVRVLLGVDAIQQHVAESLVRRLAVAAAGGDEDSEQLVRGVLRQLRWLDYLVDGAELTERLMEVLPV